MISGYQQSELCPLKQFVQDIPANDGYQLNEIRGSRYAVAQGALPLE